MQAARRCAHPGAEAGRSAGSSLFCGSGMVISDLTLGLVLMLLLFLLLLVMLLLMQLVPLTPPQRAGLET